MHKCDGCKYRSEHQEMGFRPVGVCTLAPNLARAAIAYDADKCPFLERNKAPNAIYKPEFVKIYPGISRNSWSYRSARTHFNVTADGMLICNNCETGFYRVVGEMFKHCPECGTRMIGGEDSNATD